MRPVTRGDSPQVNDFDDYRDAFGPLAGRIGPYCSYCERLIPTQLAVEHIQAKNPAGPYAHLEGSWINYLLGCVNCNGTKGDKDVQLGAVFACSRAKDEHSRNLLRDYGESAVSRLRKSPVRLARLYWQS